MVKCVCVCERESEREIERVTCERKREREREIERVTCERKRERERLRTNQKLSFYFCQKIFSPRFMVRWTYGRSDKESLFNFCQNKKTCSAAA